LLFTTTHSKAVRLAHEEYIPQEALLFTITHSKAVRLAPE
jgi:hypothetical protein